MKKAFTLAEVLIVLVVIGVLTMILLPTAFQAAPDENVVKFKKANNTLATVIRELVASDKYYVNGDLGLKANNTATGQLLTPSASTYTYFCNTIAEVLSYKSKSCSSAAGDGTKYVSVDNASKIATAKTSVDTICANAQKSVGAEIITSDGVAWFQGSPQATFGMYNTGTTRLFSDPSKTANYVDDMGFDRIYKVMCFDVDGVNKGEAPFGYGIRADGKILAGTRADVWVDKAIQKE